MSSKYYDDQTLEKWQARYDKSINQIYNQWIYPNLSMVQRNKLANINISIPILVDKYEPVSFLRRVGTSEIIMSAQSLKFLDDISTAYAWLYVNDYSLETITDYMAMLRYQGRDQFPGKRYPLPLDALQIPDNSLSDPKVDELALRLFNGARTYILAHEIGHIIYNHPGYKGLSRKDATKNEIDADKFALDIIERIDSSGIFFLGVILYHQVYSHWNWDNNNSTHPTSASRIRTISSRENDISRSIFLKDLANTLEDEETQNSTRISSENRDLRTLAPRRPGELSDLPIDNSLELLPFQGNYSGDHTRYLLGEEEILPVNVQLQRNGNKVFGVFNFGLGDGKITGEIDNNVLYFNWNWYNKEGKGELRSIDNIYLQGSWGYLSDYEDGGEWDLSRKFS
ncbi:MAG: hypothetical protein AB4372_18230 [Xenococcus sp. (in: cyanobacteria)]